MTETQYKQALLDHDWFYQMSDDHRIYSKGEQERSVLRSHAANHAWFKVLFEHAQGAIFARHPIEPFPTKPGTPAEESEPTTPKPNTSPMKEILQLVFTTLIQPLVEAIDRLTAATDRVMRVTSGCAPTTPPPADEETPATPKKRGPKPKAEEPAPAPAPEPAAPEPEEEEDELPAASTLTLDDVKAFVKTVKDQEKRDKFKKWLKKNYDVETTAELKPDSYGAVIETLKKLGATDSRIPAADTDDDI